MVPQQFEDENKRYELLSVSAQDDVDKNDDSEPVQNYDSFSRKPLDQTQKTEIIQNDGYEE